MILGMLGLRSSACAVYCYSEESMHQGRIYRARKAITSSVREFLFAQLAPAQIRRVSRFFVPLCACLVAHTQPDSFSPHSAQLHLTSFTSDTSTRPRPDPTSAHRAIASALGFGALPSGFPLSTPRPTAASASLCAEYILSALPLSWQHARTQSCYAPATCGTRALLCTGRPS